jgi:uncharacterized protein
MTSLVYPGASHCRFEHSLGVMELAGRVYDVVTDPANLVDGSVRSIVPAPNSLEFSYRRRVLRMAALCHDIGHLPFSHAAEKELLPQGWDHERLTVELVRGPDLASIWTDIKVQTEDVAKIAVGPKKYRDGPFSVWEAILAEIVVGNAFGVDRIDYLLRDSYHAGVAYGKFDHYRLIDTLRILPKPTPKEDGDEIRGEPGTGLPGTTTATELALKPETAPPSPAPAGAPTLGVTAGGLHSAEALLLARFFMYTQVYFHPVRRIYDKHLQVFLKESLEEGFFSTDLEKHLALTDNELMSQLLAAARDSKARGHDPARRVVHRDHFRLIYERNPNDLAINPEAAKAVFEAAKIRFGEAFVHYDSYREKGQAFDFPVLGHDGRIASCLLLSETLKHVSLVAVDFVFVAPHCRVAAEQWLAGERHSVIAPKSEIAG